MYRESYDEVMNQANSPYEEYLKVLRDSTMFHMSLGSKELFHSNFLHWISIVNWDAFLKIMHDLASLNEGEVFWWEEMNCEVEGHKGKYCPDNNNIEVRREFHNFDLSIYILDSEKQAKGNQMEDGEESTDKEDINTNGERMVQKWIPVLILENKMKSLPYEEQLERYTNKACEEWRKGARQSDDIKITKNRNQTNLNTQYGITFILLSLIRDNNSFDGKEKAGTIKYKKNKEEHEIKVKFVWKHKTYNELLDSIERAKTMPSWSAQQQLNKDVVDDYSKFVKALCTLASNYWTIKPDENYRLRIFPWNIDNNKDAEEKRNEIEKYKKLRIHDIHEKLLYAQLLSLLEDRLRDEKLPFCRYSKEAIQEQSNNNNSKPIRIYTNLSYAHGVGIFEVTYILAEILSPQSGKKEIFKLIIQIQGDRYCHMVIYDDIVKEEKNKNGKKLLSVDVDILTSAWKDNLKSQQGTIDKYIYLPNSNVCPNKILGNNLNKDYQQYGKNLIYQFVEIPSGAIIQDVIDAIVNDVKEITNWFRNP